MEVDHFNPHKKRDAVQHYENLFLATRHCNGAKRDRWPSNKDRHRGARFLNCCKERDYDVHIFEDPDTHEVVGVTPEGRYHVRNCDLNAPHLIEERAERAKMWLLLESQPVSIKDRFSPPDVLLMRELVQQAIAQVGKMIPRIQYLSGEDLEKQRALKKALAAISGR